MSKGGNQIPVSLGLEKADGDSESAIGRIVASHLHSRGRSMAAGDPEREPLWTPEYFGLHRVTRFRQAAAEQQREILEACGRTLLNEAYFIEKSGAAYCAKMILLAESTGIRQVYSLIAADEASHLQWIRPYVLESDRENPGGALLQFLTGLIEACDMNTLAFLVQVILEGWGLHHYRSLSQSCREPELRAVFHAIHKDEALHHHTGEVVFDPARLDPGQVELVRESLNTYCEMVRVGPQAVAGVLHEAFGGLDQNALTTVFRELDTESVSREKLHLLRELMSGPGRDHFVAELDERGAFTPLPPEACAAAFG